MSHFPLLIARCIAAFLFIFSQLSCQSDDNTVSFVTFGDWGTGNINQWGVSLGVRDFCGHVFINECEFILTLGDNFYDDGVSSIEDPQWETTFKDMYEHLDLPFYASLGSHDATGSTQAQIDYSDIHELWNMPGEYYLLSRPEGANRPTIDIFIINSFNFSTTAQTWLIDNLNSSNAHWKILAANAPIISNAVRGEDEAGINSELVPIICDKIDLVVSGHDHYFAHLIGESNSCTVEQLIVGTGGANLHELNEDDRALYSIAERGLGWFEFEHNQTTFKFLNINAEALYRKIWVK